MIYSGLMVHMIEEHAFFEGHVRYRVDPLHAALVFGLPTKQTLTEVEALWQQKLAELSLSPDRTIREFARYHLVGNYLEQHFDEQSGDVVIGKPTP